MVKNLIFALLFFGICWNINGLKAGLSATVNLADVILKSTYSLESKPGLTANCFQIYMPKINNLTQQYEQAYNGCLNLTTEADDKLKEQVQDDIDTIQNVTQTMCSNFESCSSVTNSLYDIFECYYNVAGNNMQSAFEVQNISKDKMKYVQIREEYIMYNQTVCTDECSRIYVEDTAKVHADLEACLNGKPPQETTTPAGPEDTTNESPLVTTVAPNNKEPETTVAPEIDTTVEIESEPIAAGIKIPDIY